MGIATLVRPQSIVLAPALGWLAGGRLRRRAAGAAAVLALALVICAPWTARNCARMDRCALVSVNGGWNLAIGAQTRNGSWQEIAVPEPCKLVFHEAQKDDCFGREAARTIRAEPLAWLGRAPAKLRATFDYFGAAPWYLHDANPDAFRYEAKVALGAVETLVARLLLAAALVAVFRIGGGRAHKVLAAIGLATCVFVHGWIAYVALALAIVALGGRRLARAPLVVPFGAAVVLATAATHAVFFGAGRYGLVVLPFVTVLAFCRTLADRRPRAHGTPVDAVQAIAGRGHTRREESPSSGERDAG
jgi:hypothetical protein